MAKNQQNLLERWLVVKEAEPTASTSNNSTNNIENTILENNQHTEENENIVTIEIESINEENVYEVKNTKRKWLARKVQKIWTSKYTWLVADDSVHQGKKCNICNVSIAGGRFHIERHLNSEQHKNIEAIKRKNLSIEKYTAAKNEELKLYEKVKTLEISLSMFIAEHNLPFAALDHLNKCLKNNISDSKIVRKLCINRRKGQNIIRKITGPLNSYDISESTKNQYFSIVIDESTDCTMSNNLAVIVRILNTTVKDRFLGLVHLKEKTSQGIFDALIAFLNEKKIVLQNMIGFTADNCNVMMGKSNGVQAKLKEILPKLFVNGCVCHNLNLVSIAAAKELPTDIDNLIREINHHFCNSSSRKADFVQFQEHFGTDLHVILRYAPTRWLSRQAAIDRIIAQWTPLTYYFTLNDFETAYGNENIAFISNFLNNSSVKLYFLFLSYALKIINSLNLEMQAEEPKMHIFLPRLKFLFTQFARNFISKVYLDCITIQSCNLNINHLSDTDMFCGVEVERYIKSNVIDNNILKKFYCDVRNFYIKFCTKLREKVDFDSEALNIFPKFSPQNVLSGETNSILNLLIIIFPDKEVDNAEIINSEYRSIADYDELKKFKDLKISEFWFEISQIKNELNEKIFSNIYRIAQGVLSLPHSSANVERIFSYQNLIKTKCRNRLAIKTCDSLIQTKDLIKSKKCSCFDYKITKDMLKCTISDEVQEEELLID